MIKADAYGFNSYDHVLFCCVALPPENAQVDFVERFRAFDSACLLCEQ